MIDYWNMYNGKTLRELNPYHLKLGDLVIAPDGTTGRLSNLGFKWGDLEGNGYYLVDLRPVI